MPGQVASQPEAKGGGFAPALQGSPRRPAQGAEGDLPTLGCQGEAPWSAAGRRLYQNSAFLTFTQLKLLIIRSQSRDFASSETASSTPPSVAEEILVIQDKYAKTIRSALRLLDDSLAPS